LTKIRSQYDQQINNPIKVLKHNIADGYTVY